MFAIIPLLAMSMASFSSAQMFYQLYNYEFDPSGCNKEIAVSPLYDASEPQCIHLGAADYNMEIGWLQVGYIGTRPGVYVCASEGCNDCIEIIPESGGAGRSDCCMIQGGPYIMV